MNNSVLANYQGDRNTGGDRNSGLPTQSQQQKHRQQHSSGGGTAVQSSLKGSLVGTNNPFVSVQGGTIDSNFRGHAKNALSMGTYENSAKMVKRNNYMSGNSSLKNSQHGSSYGFSHQ